MSAPGTVIRNFTSSRFPSLAATWSEAALGFRNGKARTDAKARRRKPCAKFLIQRKIGRVAAAIISFGIKKNCLVSVAVVLSSMARIRRFELGMVW